MPGAAAPPRAAPAGKGHGGILELNGRILEEKYFPELARRLKEEGEVYVDADFYSHFSLFLRDYDYFLWMATEQAPGMTDDDMVRFYVRR